MTNYNDGKWHGWNGGECPVHPNTKVEVVYLEPVSVVTLATLRSDTASNFSWKDEDAPIVAFRVLREHKEPRGGWVLVSPYGGGMRLDIAICDECVIANVKRVHGTGIRNVHEIALQENEQYANEKRQEDETWLQVFERSLEEFDDD